MYIKRCHLCGEVRCHVHRLYVVCMQRKKNNCKYTLLINYALAIYKNRGVEETTAMKIKELPMWAGGLALNVFRFRGRGLNSRVG